MELKFEKEADVFKALCDPNRITIIELLKDGERCACKLLEELDIGQSTLSHHMKILCDAGFVEYRREGKWMHYTLKSSGFETAKRILNELSQ